MGGGFDGGVVGHRAEATQRRAPMAVMLEAEVRQMERLAGAQRVAA